MVQNLNVLLPKVRTIIFGAVVALSLLVIVVAAVAASRWGGIPVTYTGLSIATAVLSLLSLPPLWWLSVNRKGAFTSMVVVEYPWFCFLWILWIASAGSSASAATGLSFFSSSDAVYGSTAALAAFAFFGWFATLGYSIFLIVFVIKAQLASKSSEVWFASVNEFDWDGAVAGNGSGGIKGGIAPVTTAPQYPPQGQPMQYATQPQYTGSAAQV
ncbi:hypothetical protein FA15DRAFT_698707 [Coprinopsis marcescibilis]|uniref:MARVEL domain-containing protein n=1 Tax=Coprinopsis marcescibilis TaxID=230819 RepID=A0A5C3K9W8_COPMA|nr:hypothetical protein FA15DRAFT_698707 [Coprinopsis marcescibilis]